METRSIDIIDIIHIRKVECCKYPNNIVSENRKSKLHLYNVLIIVMVLKSLVGEWIPLDNLQSHLHIFQVHLPLASDDDDLDVLQ
jgi:hypothetical protein